MNVYFKGGCDLARGTRGKTHPQPAFKVANLAAGGSAVKDASGGPAGGQAFEKLDKQTLKLPHYLGGSPVKADN